MWRVLLVLGGIQVAAALSAQEMHSGGKPIALVELYTSQGCSSCPPADAFISSLLTHEGLFTSFIPMAFHVDYWNYLGWRDPYSSNAHSSRQRLMAQVSRSQRVYTPEVFVAGEEWRGILQGGAGFDRVLARPTAPVGNLVVSLSVPRMQVSFSGRLPEQARVNWAWLGAGLDTSVAAGENHGRKLRNDFVVLGIYQQSVDALPVVLDIQPPPQRGQQRTALVVWLSSEADPRALQAVADWLQP